MWLKLPFVNGEEIAEERRGGSDGGAEGSLLDERFGVWLDVLQVQARLTGELERKVAKEAGIPLAFYEVLLRLEKAPERRMRMQELGRSVFLSKSGVSRLVSRMEGEGLIVRRGDPGNLRVTYAVITEEGRKAFRKAEPVALREVEERFTRHLTREEARTLRRVLGRVIRATGEEPSGPKRGATDSLQP